MSNSVTVKNSPLEGIDYSFGTYLKKKKAEVASRMDGNGIPDYAYKYDYEYRKKLDAIPGLFNLGKTLLATVIQQEKQKLNMDGVRVGPKQFPEIYEMAQDCAKRLGIPVPTIYVADQAGGSSFNACSYCTDDQESLIVLAGLMLERMTPGELKAVIGHECGHSQNHHGVYKTLSNMLLSYGAAGILSIPGLQQFAGVLTRGVTLTLNMWSRAGEVTADRAALICCDTPEDGYNVNRKLLYGGVDIDEKYDGEFDFESLESQMQDTMGNLYRLKELDLGHPLSIKRIFAEKEFAQCEVFYKWRPELREAGMKLYTKEETDMRCKAFIDVVMPKGGEK